MKLQLLLVAATTLFSCRSQINESALDSELSQNAESQNKLQKTAIDKSHCGEDNPKGRCFTLYIKIPKSTMIQDIGLSMLAMASESKELRPFVHEACRRGILEFYLEESKLRVIPHVIRAAFTRQASSFNCVFLPMNSFEEELEKVPLEPTERGMVIRLTKFEVEGRGQNLSANLVKFSRESTRVHLKYRDAHVAAGPDLGGQTTNEWILLTKLGPDQRSLKQSFNNDIEVAFNQEALKRDLQKLTNAAPNQTAEAFKSFVNIGASAMASTNPVTGGLVFLGMGMKLYKQACHGENDQRDPELCGYAVKSGLKTEEIASNIYLPTSENSEELRSSIIHLTAKILDDIFKNGDGRLIRKIYNF